LKKNKTNYYTAKANWKKKERERSYRVRGERGVFGCFIDAFVGLINGHCH
jgi:hypothetical protein